MEHWYIQIQYIPYIYISPMYTHTIFPTHNKHIYTHCITYYRVHYQGGDELWNKQKGQATQALLLVYAVWNPGLALSVKPRFTFIFPFIIFFIFFGVFPACTSVHCVPACCPLSPEESIRFPWKRSNRRFRTQTWLLWKSRQYFFMVKHAVATGRLFLSIKN